MMLVNNETGALQPVAQAAQLLRRKQSAALLHTDAVRAFEDSFTPKGLGWICSPSAATRLAP
ncbi:MAG: hypothetical protein ACLS43_01720 [Evtepia gabavorous]